MPQAMNDERVIGVGLSSKRPWLRFGVNCAATTVQSIDRLSGNQERKFVI